MDPTKLRISTGFRGFFRGTLQLPSQVSSSWEKSFLSYKCVLLIYIWKKDKIRGSCMSRGRNATKHCTSMCQENRSQGAGTALACRLETPVFRKGWIWKGIDQHVLKLPSTVRDFQCLSGVRRWILGSWPLFPHARYTWNKRWFCRAEAEGEKFNQVLVLHLHWHASF